MQFSNFVQCAMHVKKSNYPGFTLRIMQRHTSLSEQYSIPSPDWGIRRIVLAFKNWDRVHEPILQNILRVKFYSDEIQPIASVM